MAHPPVAAAAHAAALAAAIAQAGAVVAQAGAAQGAPGLALPPSTSHGSGAELQAAPIPGDDTRSESAAGPCPNDRRRSSRMPSETPAGAWPFSDHYCQEQNISLCMMPISDGRAFGLAASVFGKATLVPNYVSPVLKAASRLWQHEDYFLLDHAMICAR